MRDYKFSRHKTPVHLKRTLGKQCSQTIKFLAHLVVDLYHLCIGYDLACLCIFWQFWPFQFQLPLEHVPFSSTPARGPGSIVRSCWNCYKPGASLGWAHHNLPSTNRFGAPKSEFCIPIVQRRPKWWIGIRSAILNSGVCFPKIQPMKSKKEMILSNRFGQWLLEDDFFICFQLAKQTWQATARRPPRSWSNVKNSLNLG